MYTCHKIQLFFISELLGLGHSTIKLATMTKSTSISLDISVIFVVVPLSYSRRCCAVGVQDYDCDKSIIEPNLHARIPR